MVTGINKGILHVGVCIGVALLQSTLVQAQDAVPRVLPEPTILPELSKRTGPEPMKAKGTPIPDAEKPSIEILAGILNEKPAPVVKQTPPPETLALPAAAVEKKAAPVKRTIVQAKAPEQEPPEPVPAIVLTLSALKAVATSAPLPDYPYQAKRSHVTGSGICTLVVDTANGRVMSSTMAQSTGSQLLDKVTTQTFARWRFKPGTISQVQVPITYE